MADNSDHVIMVVGGVSMVISGITAEFYTCCVTLFEDMLYKQKSLNRLLWMDGWISICTLE